MTLRAGDVTAIVDVGAGGRVASLSIAGTELLWSGSNGAGDADPLVWGLYPMVPFAGRIRDGSFIFDGTTFELPKTAGAHAIHGYGFVNAWTQVDETAIGWEFAEPWPFAGRVTQRYSIRADEFRIDMLVEAVDRQPMLIGWHPWFVRENNAGPLEIELSAGAMYQRDSAGIADRLGPVGPRPWDDCFTDLSGPPRLRWGNLCASLLSSLDHWVVFDHPEHALCIEPQSGPPNEINTNPRVLEAGEQLAASLTIRWNRSTQ